VVTFTVSALKSILIISPQPWDFIQISKHHYARAAADCGHQVYFLEPPDESVRGVTLTPTDHSKIIRVRHSEPVYGRVRFHARSLYNWLEKFLITKIKKAIGTEFDLVWSFESNRFHLLREFGGKKVIYHPVDSLGESSQLLPAQQADQVYAVSKTILAPFLGKSTPAALLPHGVAPPFAVLAERNTEWVFPAGGLKVGFAGNLSRPIVARAVLLALMKNHPEVEFHFWGQAELPLDADAGAVEFVKRLKSLSNCRLRGIQNTTTLAADFAGIDAFLLAYQPHPRDKDFDFSNSHKILEYLATGRVTLSSPLSEYEGRERDFMLFAEGNTQEAFENQFRILLGNLSYLNGAELAKVRRECALQNRYETHWAMIEKKLDAGA
jgi:hypothetical protein